MRSVGSWSPQYYTLSPCVGVLIKESQMLHVISLLTNATLFKLVIMSSCHITMSCHAIIAP